jgi:hypothetical protein
VKTELIETPPEEWEPTADLAPPDEAEEEIPDEERVAGWRGVVGRIPTIYRVAAAGAVVVLVTGFFLGGRSDAAGSVTADRSRLSRPCLARRPIHWGLVSTIWSTVGTPYPIHL